VIVLDASAAVEMLLATEWGERVLDRVGDPAETIHVPHLLAVEVAQVLRRLVTAGDVSAPRAAAALEDLADLDADRYAHEPFLARMHALRANLTAYDAAYVALAEVLDAPLVSFDRRLAAAPGHRATIVLLGTG
jgi:predicted nucleic acid-binding protein